MIETDDFNKRIQDFEKKLADLEQMLMRMCSSTEEKIDRVLVTLNDIHDLVMQPEENEKHDVYYEFETDEESDSEQDVTFFDLVEVAER